MNDPHRAPTMAVMGWKDTRAHGWRKIATAVWGWPNDPQIFGRLEVDADPIVRAIDATRERTGEHVTVTHVVTKGIACALRAAPSINTKLVRGHFVPRPDVSVFVVVAAEAGAELDGVKVTDADRKALDVVAGETTARVRALRDSGGTALARSKRLLDVLPTGVLKYALRASAFATIDLGLDLSAVGLPRDPFGGALVTNVGMFGVPDAFAPLSAMYRMPICVLVGEVERKPWVAGDRVEPHDVLPISATIDHRWVDGFGVAQLAKTFRAYLADPLAFEAAVPEAPTEVA